MPNIKKARNRDRKRIKQTNMVIDGRGLLTDTVPSINKNIRKLKERAKKRKQVEHDREWNEP